MKSLKLKYNPGQNVAGFCDTTLVDAERLERDVASKPEHLSHTIHIFEDTSDSRFHIWVTQKYKEFMAFINKLCVCEEYFIRPDDIITYGTLVQEDMCEYRNILDSKRW